ncbi:hypothetical protein [Paraglaciecola sp. L3A3]|uniref:hypothetical protein n=1 Tax=Paraglaciecola sp. L3A3 TaxID=2686358 RepID=UPI00131ACA88|nr:hypothetical protein [Paraglaciecola sp. L3A3]
MSHKSIIVCLYLFFVNAQLTFVVHAQELDFGFDSKYISEGRHNLQKGGIGWLQLSHQLSQSISVIGLYGEASDYNELNLSVLYSNSYAEMNYYFSLTHLEFMRDNLNDTELGFGASYAVTEPITIALDSVYSREAEGGFIEFSVSYLAQINTYISLAPYAKAGLDYGYASDIKEGYNHTAVGIVTAFLASRDVSFNLTFEHNISAEHVKQETEKRHQTWLGLHLVYLF